MWWEDMSGRWWQGHHYPKQTSERGSVCERGRNSVCVCMRVRVCSPHASLSDENERSPLQALCASKDTIYEGTIFAQAQLWVRDYVYASVCVCENLWRLMREMQEKQQGMKRERAHVGGNHLQSVSTRTPMALMKEDRHTALQIAHQNLVFHLTAQDIS